MAGTISGDDLSPAASELRFCPRCREALEWGPAGDAGALHPTCVACSFVLWQNPKPCVQAVILRGEGEGAEVLLGRQIGEAAGRWDMPGNFLNTGDSLEDALRRECRREMDVGVHVGEVIGAYDGMFLGMHVIDIVYACRVASGEARAADLIDEVRWFRLDTPPPLASESTARALEAARARIEVAP